MSDTFLSRYVGKFAILHSPCVERKAIVSDTFLSRYVGTLQYYTVRVKNVGYRE